MIRSFINFPKGVPPTARLLVIDFKDRRDERQRASYGAIEALRQAKRDRDLEEEWRRRVAANEANRLTRKFGLVKPDFSLRHALNTPDVLGIGA